MRAAAQSNTMHQVLSESETEVDRLKGRLTARDGLVTALDKALDKAISRHSDDLDAFAAKLAEKDAMVLALESELAALKASTSWRVSAPVRAAKRLAVQFRYSLGVYALRLGLRALRRRSLAPLHDWRATRAIARSGLFDREWYRSNNPDVLQWGIDPVRHYIIRGARMGRDPSPTFSTLRYLADNPDIAATGLNPLTHAVRYGLRQAPAGEPNESSAAGPSAETNRGALTDEAREWSDYLPLRLRIADEEAARIGSITTGPCDILDIPAQDLPAISENLALPSCADPLVSIVVPAFNNVKLTVECLLSIAKHAEPQVPFEVILADDASSDDTAALLPKVKNLCYLRNAESLGFLRNCNNAARSARGHYLLFLNNDVQVTQGWLSALVSTFQKQRDVGAAGAKIVYPSGRLREAGARLNRDGTSQMIGLTDDPSLPRFNYPREVDYCSGACLLVERATFWQVGGFSDRFAPAYCEDADLCLKLRRLGLRTIYNPASVIVHHLGGSSEHADKMRRIAANQQKLAEQWQGKLDQLNDVKVIAFYLPQFHAIAENDEWWGRGFTEWSNVVRARPNFTGHYQPRRPAELGYYDLRDPEAMQAQADLARSFGVHGFCYYYFWFAGKQLLELPLERMLQSGQPDFPFCLCWANENWSRRWDGLDADVLIAQQHSDDDDAAVIRDMMRYFRSGRYIRIGGRPLVLVYRVDLFPDFARTAMIWRDICRREGVGEIYLAMVASFDLAATHPATYGCDAAVEFPPHGRAPVAARDGLTIDPDFRGQIYDYREYAVSALKKPIPPFTRFRTVMPSWDNTPRRQSHGHAYINSTPGTFQAWLEAVMQCTREQNAPDQRFVFINAWNEWGEGAYLEPDRRFGRGYLQAIRNAHE
jgi:GT2 family glycosyltransferase